MFLTESRIFAKRLARRLDMPVEIVQGWLHENGLHSANDLSRRYHNIDITACISACEMELQRLKEAPPSLYLALTMANAERPFELVMVEWDPESEVVSLCQLDQRQARLLNSRGVAWQHGREPEWKALHQHNQMEKETMRESLDAARRERLEMLAEEAAEIVQAVTKILRHGYHSHHPTRPSVTNRHELGEELKDLTTVVDMMRAAGDLEERHFHIGGEELAARVRQKLRYTDHQPDHELK